MNAHTYDQHDVDWETAPEFRTVYRPSEDDDDDERWQRLHDYALARWGQPDTAIEYADANS